MKVFEVGKRGIPWPIRRLSRRIKREVNWLLTARQPARAVFQQIYAERRWADDGEPFHSGPGSDGMAATLYAECIRTFIAAHGIRSVVDLGCGDFRVAQRFVSDAIHYTGIDIVEPLIARNRSRFGSDRVRFDCLDITSDPIPAGELCSIREVLQHLSNREIEIALRQVAGFPYVIYSDYQPGASPDVIPNKDIPHGQDTRIWRNSGVYLDKPPFSREIELLLEVPAQHFLRAPGEVIRTFLLRNA